MVPENDGRDTAICLTDEDKLEQEREVMYETDEEEFSRPRVHVREPMPEKARKPGMRFKSRRKLPTQTSSYNLSYFNLWWQRMWREGEKEQLERLRKERSIQNSA